jgi:pyruvate/2-oxoglutarate dehydrogenase complex dihydrolipoamide acyltransferase (E2) component
VEVVEEEEEEAEKEETTEEPEAEQTTEEEEKEKEKEEQETEEKVAEEGKEGEEGPVEQKNGACSATSPRYLQHDSSVDKSGKLVHGPCHRSRVKVRTRTRTTAHAHAHAHAPPHTHTHTHATYNRTQVMTSCDPGTAHKDVSIKNKMLYAKLHGYDFEWWVAAYKAPQGQTPRPPIWTKTDFLLDVLAGTKGVSTTPALAHTTHTHMTHAHT